jgi:peptidylprolyl isomerase
MNSPEDILTKTWRTSLLISLVLGLAVVGACSGGNVAKVGDKVKVEYTGKLADGTVFDSSVGKTPLEFTLGDGKMIKGFDKAVMGMKVGETKTVSFPPADGYGERLDSLVTTVPRSQIPASITPVVGQQLQAMRPDGSRMAFSILAVTDSTVTLDANSPLAGKTLTFEIKLLEITPTK